MRRRRSAAQMAQSHDPNSKGWSFDDDSMRVDDDGNNDKEKSG